MDQPPSTVVPAFEKMAFSAISFMLSSSLSRLLVFLGAEPLASPESVAPRDHVKPFG